MKKLLAFIALTVLFINVNAQSDRDYWLSIMDKMAKPLMYNLSQDKLKEVMPVELSKRTDNAVMRKAAAYLEGFARMFCGMSTWLNIEDGNEKERGLRSQYREWIIKGLKNGVNPFAKDYMNFTQSQSLVDAAFLALGLIRCPWLWNRLDSVTKQQVVTAFHSTQKIKPAYSNWILFSGMIEAFFCKYGYDWDIVRVEFCIRQFEQWYVGDGVYSDGIAYHWDYYNSYVIHPFLNAIAEVVSEKNTSFKPFLIKYKERSERYAVIQERLINTDGSFPATGRSIVYRAGAFHHLADMVVKKKLPESLLPAQVRCALTAVIKKTTESNTTFNSQGWLTIGLYGYQPDLADTYNNTGSLYLTSFIFLPLGLPPADSFWADASRKFTSQKIWSGEDVRGDHAIDK
ncbi:MAG: hypothetical protein C0459_11500 [Chitinophaga sp.]|jgi:hypothetical protein|nr:hypothetical protein [Chitinophaga sp.]